jgi:hypothetical protein
MIDHEYVGNLGLKLSPASEYFFTRATCAEVRQDIDFFLSESQKATDLSISKRYARAAIVFTAFYVESLANLLLAQITDRFGQNAQLDDFIKKRDHCPKPLRVLYGAYLFLNGKPIGRETAWDLDTSAVEDLFLIRNQVLAHPPARSIVAGTGVVTGQGLTQKAKPLPLKKFAHFPNVYHEFTNCHALELYEETKLFLTNYGKLLSSNPTEPKIASLFA